MNDHTLSKLAFLLLVANFAISCNSRQLKYHRQIETIQVLTKSLQANDFKKVITLFGTELNYVGESEQTIQLKVARLSELLKKYSPSSKKQISIRRI